MSIDQKLAELEQSMDFGIQLKQKVEGNPERVILADNALQINGIDIDGFNVLSRGEYDQHKNNTGNPHDVVLDVPTTEMIDSELDLLLDEGFLPISRFGTMGYLPVNVSGEPGAAMDLAYNPFPCCIERDGTFSYLRIASSGEKRDLYYAYIENLTQLDSEPLSHPVYTSRRYRPFGFPVGGRVHQTYPSYLGVVAGMVAYDDLPMTPFIAVTQDTLDDTQHMLLGMDITTLNIDIPQRVAFFRHTHHTTGDYLYVIKTTTFLSTNTTAPTFQLFKSTQPVNVLQAGDIVEWELVVNDFGNWSVTDINGVVQNQENGFSFSSTKQSTITGATMVLVNDGISGQVFRINNAPKPIIDVETGMLRFLYSDTGYFTLGALALMVPIGFSFTVDLTNVTANIDNKNWPLTVSSAGDMLVVSNPEGASTGIINTTYDRNAGVGFVTYNDRFVILRSTDTSSQQPSIYTAQLISSEPNTSNFDKLAVTVNNTVSDVNSVLTTPIFPSVIGSSLRAPVLLNNQYGIVSCNGNSDNGEVSATGPDSFVFFKSDTTDMSYTYISDYDDGSSVSQLGPPPAFPRRRLTDMGFGYQDFSKLIQCSRAVGDVSAVGGWFASGVRNSVPKRVNASVSPPNVNLQVSIGRVLCSDAVLNPVKNTILSLEGLASLHRDSRIELCYFNSNQLFVDIPHFVCVTTTTTDNKGYFFVYHVTCATNNIDDDTVITSISIVGKIGQSTPSVNVNTNVNVSVEGIIRSGAIIAHELDNAFFVGFQSIFTFDTTNSSFIRVGGMGRLRCDLNTGSYVMNNITNTNPITGLDYYWSCPSLGVGLLYGAMGNVNKRGSRLLFKPYGDTNAEVDTWSSSTYPASATRVIVANKEPVNFRFSFPSPLPVMILGKQYTLPATTIDLSTIDSDPTNKNFFVFVGLNNGVAEYRVTTTVRADTIDEIYLGVVTTDTSSITSITMEKVTKIAHFRLSSTPRGMSIPVSLGDVHNAGNLHPDWFTSPGEPLSDIIAVTELNGLNF